jgi:hypothetical protein
MRCTAQPAGAVSMHGRRKANSLSREDARRRAGPVVSVVRSDLLAVGFPDDSATCSRIFHMAPPRFHDLAFVLSANFALQQSGCFSPGEYTSPVPVGR